jgi:manganese transport protein
MLGEKPPLTGISGSVDGWRRERASVSLPESHASVRVDPASGPWRKILAFAGPGLLVSVGYMDPGNWATDLAGGARYGYTLLSVVLVSNIMAMVLQYLALKLGIVTGRDLAQACRDHYRPGVGMALWVLCEVAIAACDLAEVIGSAIALNLLFGIPLVAGVLVTALDVMIVLALQARGFRVLEAVVLALVMTIGGCFAYELIASSPDLPGVLRGLFPTPEVVTNPGMLYIAIGILGATVMPHNLYLHSSVVQTRAFTRDDPGKRMAVRYASVDSTVALFLAFFINASILILAASAFHGTEHQDVADIGDAYRLLTPVLGASLASTVFALALLASGQASTITGTLAGQIVMEGFLNIRIRPWLRRLVTRLIAIIPAVIVASLSGARGMGDLLILSQVILSLQLSFAVVPLVLFTGDRRKMGAFVNGRGLRAVAWVMTSVIVSLNGYLLVATAIEWLGD